MSASCGVQSRQAWPADKRARHAMGCLPGSPGPAAAINRMIAVVARSSSDLARFGCAGMTDIVENFLDGSDAAAAFCRAAERSVDAAHPRSRRAARRDEFHLSITQDVAATDDHQAIPALNVRMQVMISGSPLMAPLRAAAGLNVVSANMPRNACSLRVDIRFLRGRSVPLVPLSPGQSLGGLPPGACDWRLTVHDNELLHLATGRFPRCWGLSFRGRQNRSALRFCRDAHHNRPLTQRGGCARSMFGGVGEG